MNTDDLIQNTSFIHKEHKEWLSQLNFYQDEIKFFQNELAMVLMKNPDSFSKIEYVDEYRQIFLKKIQAIDAFRNAIIQHEKKIVEVYASRDVDLKNHQVVRDDFLEFIKEMELIKKNFKRFASRND